MRTLVLLVLLGLWLGPAEAQTIWSRPYEPNQVAVEAIRPDTGPETAALTGATFLTGTLSLSESIEAVVEFPFARHAPSTNGRSSTTALGNPYVGMGLSSTRIPILVQLGARIPAAPTNAAAQAGAAADMGRGPAFRPDEFVLSGLLNSRFSFSRSSTIRLRTGLEYGNRAAASADGSAGTEQVWRLQYDFQWWREHSLLLTGLTVTGRARLTSPRSTQHHAALSVMGDWARIQPGLVGGLSLNDLFQDREITPFAGLTLSLTYRR